MSGVAEDHVGSLFPIMEPLDGAGARAVAGAARPRRLTLGDRAHHQAPPSSSFRGPGGTVPGLISPTSRLPCRPLRRALHSAHRNDGTPHRDDATPGRTPGVWRGRERAFSLSTFCRCANAVLAIPVANGAGSSPRNSSVGQGLAWPAALPSPRADASPTGDVLDDRLGAESQAPGQAHRPGPLLRMKPRRGRGRRRIEECDGKTRHRTDVDSLDSAPRGATLRDFVSNLLRA